ncbi:MAG: spore coat protein U domain-containing protein [Lysobacterales bacterium]
MMDDTRTNFAQPASCDAQSPGAKTQGQDRPATTCSMRSEAGHWRTALRSMGGLICLLLLLAIVPTNARADCSFDQSGGPWWNPTYFTPSPVNFTLPSTLTIPFNLSTNAVIGTPVSASPSNPPNVTCTNGTKYGVQNLVGGAPTGGSNYIYPTSVPGLGYQLIHTNDTSNFMGPYPTYAAAAGSSTYSVGSTLQLVQTGPIANGSVLPAGTFANWQWGSIVPEYFVLTNSVTFVASACNVSTTSFSVALPTVSAGAFSGKDSIAGATPFTIVANCPSGSTATLAITFAASSGVPAGYTNVLKSTGSATGLGVELRDGNGSTVVFGTSMGAGAAPSGALSLPYTALYHAISNTVTAGSVAATATFTLSYQ